MVRLRFGSTRQPIDIGMSLSEASGVWFDPGHVPVVADGEEPDYESIQPVAEAEAFERVGAAKLT